MAHIGDTLIRKAIQQMAARRGLQFESVARYELNGGQLWVAIGSRHGVPEEVVFTGAGPLVCTPIEPTYRTQEHLPEEES